MSEKTELNKELFEIEKKASELFVAGDIDQMCEYLSEDIMLLNPGSELIVGKEHERLALLEASKIEGLEMTFEPKYADVSASGDMGFVYGEVSTRLPDGSEQGEKYVTIYKKVEEKWQIVLQARNANA